MTMPGGPIDIELNLDTDGYIRNARAATAATTEMAAAVGTLQKSQSLLARAMTQLTPFRAIGGAFTGSTAAAAAQEQRLSQLAATQAVTGASARKLTGEINTLARSFPISQRGAEQLVQSLQRVTGLGAGSEAKLGKLATQFTKLSGATGESAEQVGTDMVRLQRAFGNSNLNTTKIERASDQLTLLSKTSGASAGGILSFSNAIAPLARSAGIGSGAVLGISTAFSKMGEDGFAASNTVNKVLTDLNRSARDGGEELNTYADIVGKTREEFEKMVRADPAQALQSVVKNLATPGEKGQRNLERIGLDGVRAQRVLTQLSAQGGFQTEIDTALRGQGLKDATQKGSEAAFGGLNDAAEQAAASAEQLAVALGAPLLKPIEALTRAMSVGTSVLTKGVTARTGVPGLNTGIPGISAGFILAAGAALVGLAKLGGIAGIAKLLGTSQISRAAFSGLATGRGATEGFASRFGAPIREAMQPNYVRNVPLPKGTLGTQLDPRTGAVLTNRDGTPRTNMAGTAARYVERFFRGVGQGIGPVAPGGTVSGATGQDVRSGAARLFSNAARYTSYAATAWSAISKDANQQSLQKESGLRRSSMSSTPGSAEEKAIRQARVGFDGAGAALRQGNFGPFVAGLKGSAVALKQWDAGIRTTQGAWGNLTRTAGALGSVFTNLVKAGFSATAGLTRLALSATAVAARGVANTVMSATGGVTGLAMIAGIVGYTRYSGLKKSREEEETRLKEMGLSDGLDKYRESVGRAGESTMTLAEAMKASARTVSTSTTNFRDALTVRSEDRMAAQNTRDDVVMQLGGGVLAIAAQIRAMGADRSPEDLNAVKIDLLRQDYSTSTVEAILQQVRPDPNAKTDLRSAAMLTDEQSRGLAAGIAPGPQVTGLQSLNPFSKDGQEETRRRQADMGFGRQLLDNFVMTPGRTLMGAASSIPGFRPGDRFNGTEVSEEQQTAIDLALQDIGGKRQATSETLGEDFGTQSYYRNINKLYEDAVKANNTDAAVRLSEQVSQELLGERKVVRPGDVGKDGLIGALADRDDDFKGILAEEYDRGVRVNPNRGGVRGNETMSNVANQADRAGGTLKGFFDNREAASGRPANKAIEESAGDPLNAKKFRAAVDAMVDGAKAGGTSLEDIAASSYRLTTAFDQTTQQYKIAQAARAEAQLQMRAQGSFQTSGQNILKDLRSNAAVAASEGNTQYSDEEKTNAREAIVGGIDAVTTKYEQRLAATREFGIQRERTEAAYELQRSQAATDFEKGRARTEYDYDLQRQRQAAAFALSMLQSEQDFQLSQERGLDDYNRNRGRSLRDYNRQMARMVEDSAKSLMDPYTRIQTQPVWDTQSLVQNMGEQLRAVQMQVDNLGTLRRRGLSTAVIDMLGLNDPNKAQQLAKIVADTATDASAIGTLNKSANDRLGATRALVADPANNRDVRRQEEDFKRGRKQEEEDFRRGLDRTNADYDRNRGRQIAANALSRKQQQADHEMQMSRQLSDNEVMLGRQSAAYDLSMTQMQADFDRSFEEFNAGFAELQKATLDAMSGATVEYGDLMVSDMGATITEMTSLINVFRGQFSDFLPDIEMLPGPAVTQSAPIKTPAQAAAEAQASRADRADRGGPSVADEGKDWSHPVSGAQATSGFGPRSSPGGIGSTNHKGQDWAAPAGTAVKAFMDAIVKSAGPAGGYGNMVELDHGAGRTTRYAHLSSIAVEQGQKVEAGQRLGGVGSTGNSTGNHLHFETRQGNEALNPVTTMPKWAGSPVPLTMGGMDVPADITDPKLLQAIALLGLTPEEFLEGVRGGGTGRGVSNAQSNRRLGQRMNEKKGWGGDWNSLNSLWTKESGWNNTAQNPTSTAYGIPQFLNGTWATVGEKKTDDPASQIRAGLKYIDQRYGDPDKAWAHSKAKNWYATGGIMKGQQVIGVGEAGPEAVIPLNETGIDVLAQAMNRFINQSQAQMMVTGTQGRSHVTYHSESHEYDQRTVVEHATVVSQDPDEMGRKLQAKARRDNLVGGPRRR